MRKWAILAFMVWTVAYGQQPMATFSEPIWPDSILKRGDIAIGIEALAYFRNTEYEGRLVDGQTWPGMRFRPTLVYGLDKRARLHVGVQIDQRAGAKAFGDIRPVLRMEYQTKGPWRLVLGTLYGHATHRLPEPAYSPERFITRPLEEGLQWLRYSKRDSSEIFVDWQRYIVDGDTAREQFVAGLVHRHRYFDDTKLEAHVLLFHRGGQINTYKPVSSVGQIGFGLTSPWKPVNNGRINATFWLYGHKNFNAGTKLFFEQGWAMQPRFAYEKKGLRLDAGYYYGRGYTAIPGELVYTQSSTRGDIYGYRLRSLVFVKTAWTRYINDRNTMSAGIETYYDLRHRRIYYAYSFYLIHHGLNPLKRKML
jgi:hypothetical protein